MYGKLYQIADYATELKQQETNTPAVLEISAGIRIRFQHGQQEKSPLFQYSSTNIMRALA